MADSRKVAATKKGITDKLFRLLESESIERITVAEVCGACGINRSTFYRHFEDLYAVRSCAEEQVEDAVKKAVPLLVSQMIGRRSKAEEKAILQIVEPHFPYLNVLLNGADPAFVERLKANAHDYLEVTLVGRPFTYRQEMIFQAVSGMWVSIVGSWLATGRRVPAEDLLRIARNIARHGPRYALVHG